MYTHAALRDTSRMEMNEWAESLCTHLKLYNPEFERAGDRRTMPATPPTNRMAAEVQLHV